MNLSPSFAPVLVWHIMIAKYIQSGRSVPLQHPNLYCDERLSISCQSSSAQEKEVVFSFGNAP